MGAGWLKLYPVTNSTLEPVLAELEKIIDAGEGGLNQNIVKLQPMSRQNAILAVSQKPELLKTVSTWSTWITQLDRSGSAGTGVKLYRMRYGDARQAAALLSEIFTGNSSTSLDSPLNQLVPGGGIVASNSARSSLAQNASSQQNAPNGSPPAPRSGGTFGDRFADASGGRAAGLPAAALARSGPSGAGTAILPNVKIVPDVTNNTLLIYANQESYHIIERTLQQLDRPQLQVAIHATIAEITLNDELRYGVQFFLTSKDLGLGHNKGSALNTAAAGATSAALSRVLPGFNFLVGTEAQPRVILDALHAVTNVKVLSTPSVVVIDNQFAWLQVGDQIPVTTRTAQSVDVPTAPVVNSIDYRNTGVMLRVAPRINANGTVLLDVEQEISAVANSSSAGTLTPTVSQRKVRRRLPTARPSCSRASSANVRIAVGMGYPASIRFLALVNCFRRTLDRRSAPS